MKPKLMLVSILILALFLLVAPTALASGTWYVDGVRGNDSNDCKTPRSACKTIGHAISLASSGDTISVAAATYKENLTIGTSLTIHGDYATSAPTIIDGGGVNTVVTIPNAATNVALIGLTIRNGYTSGNGGGISNLGTLTINRTIFSGNSAPSFYSGGGAIYNQGTLTLSQSALTGNTAWSGGGIFNTGTLTVSYSSISGNSAIAYPGGGGMFNYYGTAAITNSTFLGNSASSDFNIGGAISNWGPLTISNSTLSGNSAYQGGGIDVNSFTLTISNSTITGNSASGGPGGGISNFSGTYINNTTISGNSAPSNEGGGIANGGGGGLTLQNSIVANSPSGGDCYNSFGSINSNGYNLSSDNTCPFHNTGDLNNTDPKLGPLQNNGGPTWTQALLDGSPAIDAGNPNGCTDGNGNLLKSDQRGYPRPDPEDPSGCDMGAYERQGD